MAFSTPTIAGTLISLARIAAWLSRPPTSVIRPAARLLGISPMKLRTSLKDYLGILLSRPGMTLEKAAGELDVPPEVLEKKAKDFGLEGLGKKT